MNRMYKTFIHVSACAKFSRKFDGHCGLLHHKEMVLELRI